MSDEKIKLAIKKLKAHELYEEYFGNTDPNLLYRFLDYYFQNPELWRLFKNFAMEAKNKGRGKFSIWLIANRIRWYTQVETSGQEFKVSNDYLALYARLLMLKFESLRGFFTIKAMKKHRTPPKD